MVPRLYASGATVAILGTGPSLTQADVDALRGRVDGVIAVNDAYRLCPWATVLYAGDGRWWRWHKGAPSFTGLKFSVTAVTERRGRENVVLYPDVTVLKRGALTGLATDRRTLALGHNSVYQAINLAVHLGATRIPLLGVDMQVQPGSKDHFFGAHPDKSRPPFDICLSCFATLPKPLAACGVTVINCSRVTALKVFPRLPLDEALAQPLSVAV